MDSKTVVWGIGNEIMGDDAAGLYTAGIIKGRNIPWIITFLCGTLPENYTATLERIRPETLLIIDAADMGKKAGDTRLLRIPEIGGSSFSTHGIPIGVLLAPFEKLFRIRIIAIQPLRSRLGEGISPPVRAAAKSAADAVCERRWGNIPALQRENLSPR